LNGFPGAERPLLQTYARRPNGVKQHEETLIAGIRQMSSCAGDAEADGVMVLPSLGLLSLYKRLLRGLFLLLPAVVKAALPRD
jgi:hypothetical protein